MCLAIPGKITDIYTAEGDVRMAKVSFSGVIKDICVEWLPEAVLGDYILAHAGTAISKIDEDEAHKTLLLYKEWIEALDNEEKST